MRINTMTGKLYHIYLRGVDKQNIFLDEQDYKRFADLLNYCNRIKSQQFSDFIRGNKKQIQETLGERREELANTIIRTLMPNHFHTSVISLGDGFIGKYMQKILDSYTKYFNQKYGRKGHLFEQKYQYRKIENDYDLFNIINYIYYNPVKILDPSYKHINLLMGTYELNKKQKKFTAQYPYTYKGPVFEKYREKFNLDY